MFRMASVSLRPTMRVMPMTRMSYRAFASSSDVIDDIQQDHRELEKYYNNYKSAKTIDESHKWFNQFLWEICRHSVTEELLIYTAMETQGDRGKQLSESSREDHRELKVMLEDLRNEKDNKKFDEKFDAVYKNFQDHVKKEEGEDHPFIKEKLSLDARQKLAKAFALKKNLVPTRPHPEVPDKPTALEAALGLLITPVDKIRDLFVEFPDQKK